MRKIILKGCKEHNLKDLDLELPLYKVVCVTGVSGSGKSSLVFDTLFAEGERRYLETFSSYVRQYFERLPRPKVEAIENIPPAIAISQTNPVKSSRSTVGTLSEIAHFAKMLYFRAAEARCVGCGRVVFPADPISAARKLLSLAKDRPAILTAPLKAREKPELLREGLLQAGFYRILISDKVCDLEEAGHLPPEIEVVLDRIRLTPLVFDRLAEDLEKGFQMAGEVRVHLPYGEEYRFSSHTRCPYCGLSAPRKTPNLFSFNSPLGACPECRGFGRILDIDWDLVIPDPRKSLKDGAITVLEMPFAWDVKEDLWDYCRRKGIPWDRPWEELSEEIRQRILLGDGDWYGVKEFFHWLETKRYKAHVRILLARFRAYRECPACCGTRFRPEALQFYLGGINLGEFYALTVTEARSFTEDLLKKTSFPRAEDLLIREVTRRLVYLDGVGLSYLTLDQPSRTLSGGEVARVLLTRALSSELTETLYLLDEPTTGLHPRDTERVIAFLKKLAAHGNTAVVVEHDPEIILSSDLVVDLGPGAGEAGGKILYVGNPSKLKEKDTPTAKALRNLSSPREHRLPSSRKFSNFLVLRGASENNLKEITVRFPKGALTVVCGVSGSGKSTLVELCLYRGCKRLRGEATEPPGALRSVSGYEDFAEIVLFDQTPLARTPRGNLATYLGAYPFIRRLLASSPEAKELGLTPSHFSFNSPEGRCPECEGLGFQTIEMQFLSDLTFPCEVCGGQRFQPQILSVRWHGKTVAEILEMTVEEALEFFSGHRELVRRLLPAREVGLGYLRLGQSLSTLSGGESQRLKMAKAFGLPEDRKALLLLDEPTVGLHLQDIQKLLSAINRLVKKGHTVAVVEHHPEVILVADWVVELGPEGGEAGGYLLYEGPVKGLLEKEDSPTGKWLKRYLRGELEVGISRIPAYEPRERMISIRGARHHNLKDLDLDLPREKLIVVTGVSGSGKSTLAFDLLFAEGQRRYLESLPAYLRQFVKLYEEPEVDLISGIPPTVALEQRSSRPGPRSTVGTLTDILPYLRLLYARLGVPHCPRCGKTLSRTSREAVVLRILKEFTGERVKILSPRVRRRKGFHRPVFEKALSAGYQEVRVDGRFLTLPPLPELSRFREHTIEVVVGELQVDYARERKLRELLERAFSTSRGEAIVWHEKTELFLSEKFACEECGTSLPEPDPLLFSFNTKAGACPQCQGLGKVGSEICSSCRGARLRPEALAFRISGRNLAELSDLQVSELKTFLESLRFSGRKAEIAKPILKEVLSKLSFLIEVGLSYLSLSRPGESLSGGEAQRVRLAAEIGSNLTGVAYILDEPTIGLHPRDTEKLLAALKRLRYRGNTVIVVEHDEETIKAADLIVDLGPGGGRRGGKVIFFGSPEELLHTSGSLTAQVLVDRSRYRLSGRGRRPEKFFAVHRAFLHNLKDLTVQFPLGCLIVVTGVSGSGKSTLVTGVLFRSLENLLSGRDEVVGCRRVEGYEVLRRVLQVDHSPIGRTPRSTPATYVGFMTEIRRLFAKTREARARGYTGSRFSFNVEEGRCPACKGQGIKRVEMKFLPAVYQICEVCGGARFNEETLNITYKGKNIAEILAMTFEEARKFFATVPQVRRPLEILCELGLDYLTLGQPSPTLSGGEAQRVKLATEFVKGGRGGTLYVLDEPSTGLHLADIQKLLRLLHGLIDQGNTVIVIEHNLEVIKEADWIVDLGPEGGEEGGRLLYQGPPEGLLSLDTPTAQALKEYLARE